MKVVNCRESKQPNREERRVDANPLSLTCHRILMSCLHRTCIVVAVAVLALVLVVVAATTTGMMRATGRWRLSRWGIPSRCVVLGWAIPRINNDTAATSRTGGGVSNLGILDRRQRRAAGIVHRGEAARKDHHDGCGCCFVRSSSLAKNNRAGIQLHQAVMSDI
jgi:hypothetical protein